LPNRIPKSTSATQRKLNSSKAAGYIIITRHKKIFRYLVIKLPSRRQIIVFMTQEEFVRQVQTNQGIIQKICRLYGQTQPDREDLFQEIVVQLWKALPKFRGEFSLLRVY
jgi:hypothetical protein